MITDIRHPGIDGFKMIKRLAEERAKYAVLVISASSEGQQSSEYSSANLDVTFLEKPVNAQRFLLELVRFFGPGSNMNLLT